MTGKPRIRMAVTQTERKRRLRLYAILKRSRAAYPHNRALRLKWIKAKLLIGTMQPKVKVGLECRTTFPRTTAEANRRDDFTTLAPRTMRQAGL